MTNNKPKLMNNGVHHQHNLVEDENLTPIELDLLKRGLKEMLLIKEGKIKSIPLSELWND